MGIISINGLKIYAHHGVLEQERQVGNMFVVDIRLEVPTTKCAELSDLLIDTLNYADIIEMVKEKMATPHRLLEGAAGSIVVALLARYGRLINRGEVKISKLAPPISAELESVSYTATFG